MNIAVIGLGYVGLPLAVCLSKKFNVLGFDIDISRISALEQGVDSTGEIEKDQISNRKNLGFSSAEKKLKEIELYIVTVPTPIDEHKTPNLQPLREASRLVGKHLKPGNIVVYESTVYPGVTEEICVPILEDQSGLIWKKDFNVGYSPERINPGEKEHTIERIKKVVAGDTLDTTEKLAKIYGSVIEAGVYKASTIKTAEAAKVIENVQRDLNIALMNELAIIFDAMGICTRSVLEAAATKWNFLPFRPGLVGGHCIGVDPYYLTFRAQDFDYMPDVILAGRRINDGMGKYIAGKTVKKMIEAERRIRGARVLICGIAFKENVSDIRSTRVVDIYNELLSYHVEVFVYDPEVSTEGVRREYGISLIDSLLPEFDFDAIVLAVKHQSLCKELTATKISTLGKEPVVMDVQGFFNPDNKHFKNYWSL